MLYFAYGSNMDMGQMLTRCPDHGIVGIAELFGHQLVFPRYSTNRRCAVASIEPAPGRTTWGVVYELGRNDLASLDSSEGYVAWQASSQNRYNRVAVTVVLEGRHQPVETYVAVPEKDPGLPNLAYMNLIRAGARTHRLPRYYIAFLDALPYG